MVPFLVVIHVKNISQQAKKVEKIVKVLIDWCIGGFWIDPGLASKSQYGVPVIEGSLSFLGFSEQILVYVH